MVPSRSVSKRRVLVSGVVADFGMRAWTFTYQHHLRGGSIDTWHGLGVHVLDGRWSSVTSDSWDVDFWFRGIEFRRLGMRGFLGSGRVFLRHGRLRGRRW
jgi:hypothetical protein